MKKITSLTFAIFIALTSAAYLPAAAVEKPFTKEEQNLLQILAETKGKPQNLSYRIEFGWKLYIVFTLAKRTERAKVQLAQLYEDIRLLEAMSKPSKELIESSAAILDWMSRYFCPVPESDSHHLKGERKVSEQTFLLGESLQKRKLSLLDKLPYSDETRMYAHQMMISWYESFGKKAAAEDQRKILIALFTKTEAEKQAKEDAKCNAAIDAMKRCGCDCKYKDHQEAGGFH